MNLPVSPRRRQDWVLGFRTGQAGRQKFLSVDRSAFSRPNLHYGIQIQYFTKYTMLIDLCGGDALHSSSYARGRGKHDNLLPRLQGSLQSFGARNHYIVDENLHVLTNMTIPGTETLPY